MNKSSALAKILAGVLALVMVFGAFTALRGAFSGVKAEPDAPDGSITYRASDSSIVLNKDAWLAADGTYCIDLTAFKTGEKQLTEEQFDAPTDFIVVVDQSCTMRDSYSTGCIGGYSYSATTYTLTAAKSITRALVDALRENGGDHRVGIIGFGGYSCDSSRSNTGLFDNNGNWYNYRFSFGYQWPTSAQSKYGSTLTNVNTTAGYNALKKAISGFTYNSGAYTDIGLEMAKGVINATKNDTYPVVNADGSVSNVARKKVVIVLTDGTPGWDGFDMKIAAAAVNNATSIKRELGAKIYTVAFNTLIEELVNAWNNYGYTDFVTNYTWTKDAAPVHTNAYNPAYGTANGAFTTTKYNTLKLQGEFFSRDFTTVLSSVYPCTENYGANGPVEGRYLTNTDAYSYVGQYCYNIQRTNTFPVYNINGYYANSYVERSKSIAYFSTEANGGHKLISGLYDNNVGNFSNRIPYNYHPVDRAADPTYGKYRISVPDARLLVNGNNSNPNYENPTQALSQLISSFIAEIPQATNYSGSTEMAKIGDAYIKDIISEYFVYHNDFDVNTNVKTFTQDAIGYENGEYVFAADMVPYNYSNVEFDGKDVVKVDGFDYDANTCYLDNGVHGKKFIVQIRGLLAKPETTGTVAISNTPEMTSGIYAIVPENGGDNGGNNGGSAPVVVNNFAPITGIDLKDCYVAVDNNLVYAKQAVLNVEPANSDYTVTWTTGNSSIATVDEHGRVKPRGYMSNYTTTLTATVYDKVSGQTFTDTATVAVLKKSSCSQLSYYELGDLTIKVGSTKQAALDASPITAAYMVSYTSSDSSVAAVDYQYGKVTGVSEGTAIITATIKDQVTGYYVESRTATVTVLPETTVIDNPGTNPGTDPVDPVVGTEQLITMGGEEVIFPVPSVKLREKNIVYDFSLKIQDDDAIAFFDDTKHDENDPHDVAHVLTLDDAYAKQELLWHGEGYNYHGTYPYEEHPMYDAYKDHFEVGITEIHENGQHEHTDSHCHAHVIIKSANGESYDLAAMLQLNMTRRDIITGEEKTAYEWCRINILPATNVHYEESLFTYKDATGYNAAWTENGRPNGPTYDVTTRTVLENDTKYDDAFQSTANSLYGHDAEYHNNYTLDRQRDTHEDSNGRSMSVKVDAALEKKVQAKTAAWPQLSFDFRGTGIDIISRSGADTGVLIIDIVPADRAFGYGAGSTYGKDFIHAVVDTYYTDGLLYQIPVFHVQDLDWLEQGYKARIKIAYYAAFDHQSKSYSPTRNGFVSDLPGLEEGVVYEVVDACTYGSENVVPTRSAGSFTTYIDSIRVYNPNTAKIAANELEGHLYYEANEHNPEYNEIRNRLINAGSFNGPADRVSGIVYIDATDGSAVTIEDYAKFGPNNEAYLTPGNGFAFTVKEFDKNNTRLHISAKSPNAKNVIMSVNGAKFSIDSATELYFDVTDVIPASGRVVITCSDMGGSPDAILSVCQVKVVSDAHPTRNGSDDTIYVDQELLDFAAQILAGEQNGICLEDVIHTARFAMGLNEEPLRGFAAMDMDHDGKLTISDASLMLRIALSAK